MLLDNLNNDPSLNASTLLNNFIKDDEVISQFFNTDLSSKFYDVYSLKSDFQSSTNPLILSVNIQSLNSKFNELKIFINDLLKSNVPIDLIVLQETWNITYANMLELPGFQPLLYRNRNNMRGGGVGLYIRKGLNYKRKLELEQFQQKTFENIVVELSYPNKNILISNVYHSPNPPNNCTMSKHNGDFIEALDNHLSELVNFSKDSYVFLDSNIDMLKLNTSDLASEYLSTCISNGYLQLTCRATRIQGDHFSLIDHILTNTHDRKLINGTIVSDISDHFINFVQLDHQKSKVKARVVTKRNFTSENIQNFKNTLANINWHETLSSNSVDVAFESFWGVFSDLYQLHFPLTRKKFNKNCHRINDYMTAGLLISRKTKLELLKAAAGNRSGEAFQRYKRYRNLFNTLVRESKKNYFGTNLNLNKKNPKKTWDLLKEAANLNKTNDNVDKLMSGNTTINDPGQIAEQFNDYFVNIGTSISQSITHTNAKPEDFMPNLQNIIELDLGNISPTHICDIIKSLPAKNSLDSDGISANLLKKIANEISVPIAHVFNLSVVNGVFPSKLKRSRTVPIFKSGDPTQCDNYRPISLLSQLSKILEKIVSIQLTNHLDRNNLLYEHQYGFQRNKSTEHNLIHALNFIGKSLNANKFCIGVFFDLKKAFDVCSYDILIMKLERMGVKGIALNWFKSYLSNRTQFVDIAGSHSSDKNISTCILQGSILGPLLFLCYINDLFRVTQLLTLMFDDDTFCLKDGHLVQSK